ncbi:hypothetical protein AVEN_224795-1 [Araneus ventricosus]|uniref:Uncharacterized protein n=1 Tax=Araneus ventricosus TaxID=182803 RepID=A0A4Y2X6M8_ARAVE|nr:hypothetical protein AVEN_224795-1 [Araneus ventricosus]
MLDQLSKDLGDNWTIVTSRSPVISSAQFSKYPIDWKPLVEYYRKRVDHLKVDQVLILDYGSSFQADETYLKRAYERMLQRGREYELKAFDSFETYCKFFEKAEEEKKSIVEMYEKESEFYNYKIMPFHDFDEADVQEAKRVIWDCNTSLIV